MVIKLYCNFPSPIINKYKNVNHIIYYKKSTVYLKVLKIYCRFFYCLL